MSKNNNSKKSKYTLAKVIVALCVVLCVVLTVFEMSATYRIVKAAEVDGTEYSVAEYNWFYTNNVYQIYNEYYAQYGDFAQYFFNPQAGLETQVINNETGETWADYIREFTDASIIEMTKLYNAGVEAGFELDEVYYENCDAEWNAIAETAKEYGYSANAYAEMNYGRGVNEKVFKEMYERYYFALEYANSVSENFEVSESDIDAYYSEHTEDFDSVTFRSYYVSGTAAEGEDAEAAMDAAKAKAEAILAGTEEVQFTENRFYTKSGVNSLYADWLFDDARKAGDSEIFESETGYEVVIFMENDDLHYNTVNVRHILVTPEGSTAEAKAAALAIANTYLEEFTKNGGTEEAFAELAKEHSNDGGSAANGGLYENVYKGQMVEEFENWCFDSARKTGDCAVVETTYGYHVMYFCGEGVEYYDFVVDAAIRASSLNEYIDGLIEGVEVSELAGSKYIGKHLA